MQHRERQRLLMNARALRQSQTPAERRLWEVLRRHGLEGLKWRRQVPFGQYVLDFYCVSRRVAVELDGTQHQQQSKRVDDEVRTRRLSEAGVRVLRFTNEEVLFALPKVVERIRCAIRAL